MTTRPVPHRHPRQTDVAKLLLEGLTNTEIGARLRMDRATVGRLRRDLGHPPAPRRRAGPTLAERFAAHTTEIPGPDGHLLWTGPRTAGGSPVMKYHGKAVTGRQAAYFLERGHWPTSRVEAACIYRWCHATDHVADMEERHELRAQLRALHDIPVPPPAVGAQVQRAER